MPFVSCAISDGLGNRFFHVAAMLGYAEKHGFTPRFVKDWLKSTNHVSPKSIYDYFPSIQTVEPSGAWTTMNLPFELGFTYVDLPRAENSVKLEGIFQSEKYFPRDGIPRPAILSGLDDRYRDFAFLHVRRGDYLLPVCQHHYVELGDYYRYALALFSETRTHILVCSDDIDWCRRTLPARYGDLIAADRWEFLEGSDHETLRAMTACGKGGICANSTFSWWGAYWGHLQDSGRMYTMPGVWGHPPLPPTTDLYPSWATVLPV